MNKRKLIWIVLALILLVGVGAWVLMPAKQEARYEGKTVREWFYGDPFYIHDWRHPDSASSKLELMAMKAEAVPFLLGEIRKIDSRIHNQVWSCLHWISRGRILSDEQRRERVGICFLQLGSDADGAQQELTVMAQKTGSHSMATEVLKTFLPEAAAKAGVK